MFTEIEVFQQIRHNRQMTVFAARAQSIIDRQDAGIDAAHAEIRRMQRLLADETSKRQTAEFQVESLKALARSLA